MTVFDAFCEDRLLGPAPHGAVVGRVDRAADFFAAIGDAFANPADVDAASLLKRFGAASLRCAEVATAFLLDRLGRVWDVADPDVTLPVGPEAAPDTVAAILADYRRHLEARHDGGTGTRTIRAYMKAARGLIAFVEADGRLLPTVRDVRRLLWRTPGARASLGPFLRWVEATQATRVPLPRRAPVDRRAVERRCLREMWTLVRALEAAPAEAPSRPALLASCLSRAFGVPLGAVLSLRVEEVDAGERPTLRLDGVSVDVPERLAGPLRAMSGARSSGLAFPGRSGVKPLSTAAVRHHVRAIVGSRPRRVSRS